MCPLALAALCLPFWKFFLLLSLLCCPQMVQSSSSSSVYSLNLTALDGVWHRAAVMALLKLKAESLLASLLPEERLVFSQCAGDAGGTAVALAKCVSSLIGQRDRLLLLGGRRSRKEARVPTSTLEGLLQMLKETLASLVGTKKGEESVEEDDEDNVGKEEEEGPAEELLLPLEAANLQFGFARPRRHGQQQGVSHHGLLVHLDRLRQLQRFVEMREFCHQYLAEQTSRNAQLLRSHLPFPLCLRMEQTGKNQPVAEIGQMLAQFVQRNRRSRRLSLLSPRFFSLLPGRSADEDEQLGLLSPRLLSLAAPNDGLFPLMNLLGPSNDGRWLNRLLAISGAGQAIQQALDALSDEKQRLEAEVFPAVLQLQRRQQKWAKMLDSQQQRQLQRWGFAFLRTREQAELLYGPDKADAILDSLEANPGQQQLRLERAIHHLAQMDGEPSRVNKSEPAEGNGGNVEPEPGGGEGKGGLKLLAPFAFTNFLADGVALEALILSPHAFVSELLSPVALSAEVLSPRAFVAAILSPNALFARVLSPAAFRAEVLSPRALTPFVLSPEAMMAEVLSPRALEPRVLSPEMGVLKVLSPVFLSPRVLSPEQLAILVLSPTILSPGVLSPEALTIEVMSPHILSGGGSEEHDEHQREHGEQHQGHGEDE